MTKSFPSQHNLLEGCYFQVQAGLSFASDSSSWKKLFPPLDLFSIFSNLFLSLLLDQSFTISPILSVSRVSKEEGKKLRRHIKTKPDLG